MAYYENNYWGYETSNMNYLETLNDYSQFQNFIPPCHIEAYPYPSLDTQLNFQSIAPQQQESYSEDFSERMLKLMKECSIESENNNLIIQDISKSENPVDHNDRNNNFWEYETQQQELSLETCLQNFMQITDQSIGENQVDQLPENNYFETPTNYCQFQHSTTPILELNSTCEESLLINQNSIDTSCSHSSEIDLLLEKLKKETSSTSPKLMYLKRRIENFHQENNELFYESWERFKAYIEYCPHHGYEQWDLVHFFYEGLHPQTQNLVDIMSDNNLFTLVSHNEAWLFLDQLAEKNYNELQEELQTPSNEIIPLESNTELKFLSLEPNIEQIDTTENFSLSIVSQNDESFPSTNMELPKMKSELLLCTLHFDTLPLSSNDQILDPKFKSISFDPNFEYLDLVNNFALVLPSHVDPIEGEKVSDVFVECNSERGWDFIINDKFLIPPQNIFLEMKLFKTIFSWYADFSNMSYIIKLLTHLIVKFNKFILESNNYYLKNPYILNYKKRKKSCKLLICY